MTDLSDAKAAQERGRPVVLVSPPTVERAGALWELVTPGHGPGVNRPGPATAGGAAPAGPGPASLTPGHGPGVSPPGMAAVIICADAAAASEWVAVAPTGVRIHAVTGLARTAALLKQGAVTILAGAPKDLAALVAHSALKLHAIETIVLAWPETLVAGDQAGALDALLAEAPGARRIVLSWNPAVLGDFLERHARRAEVVGDLPLDADGRPLSPVGPARYAIVPADRRATAVREVLDVLRAARPMVWDGKREAGSGKRPSDEPSHDAVVCTTLPTRAEFVELARVGPPVVLVSAAQLAYLKSIAAPLTPLLLPTAADRALDRAEALRAEVAGRLERGDVDAELGMLAPLFERFDAAEVAGAVLALQREARSRLGLQRETGSGTREAALPLSAPAGWVKVFVNVGKKDRASAKDLVGALIKEVGLTKEQLGKIDMRETHSLVEVTAGAVERAVKGLTGVTIRGRRVGARVGREG